VLIYFEESVDVSRIGRNLHNVRMGAGATNFEIAQLRDFSLGTNMSASVSPHVLAIW
jgi:hypothetical protein